MKWPLVSRSNYDQLERLLIREENTVQRLRERVIEGLSGHLSEGPMTIEWTGQPVPPGECHRAMQPDDLMNERCPDCGHALVIHGHDAHGPEVGCIVCHCKAHIPEDPNA